MATLLVFALTSSTVRGQDAGTSAKQPQQIKPKQETEFYRSLIRGKKETPKARRQPQKSVHKPKRRPLPDDERTHRVKPKH